MPRYKSQQMVHKNDMTITTTAGHTIRFQPNVPTHVPAFAVQACLKNGARPRKQYRNTETKIDTLSHFSDGIISRYDARNFSVEEEDLDASVLEPQEEELSDQAFTEFEAKMRTAIQRLMAESSAEDFTSAGKPLPVSIAKASNDIPKVTAAQRDAVWEKMIEIGDVPDDWFDVSDESEDDED